MKGKSTSGAEPLVLELSGRVWRSSLTDVQRAVEAARRERRSVTLDCREVAHVDRRTVRFLAESRARGVGIEAPPAYLSYWIDFESGSAA